MLLPDSQPIFAALGRDRRSSYAARKELGSFSAEYPVNRELAVSLPDGSLSLGKLILAHIFAAVSIICFQKTDCFTHFICAYCTNACGEFTFKNVLFGLDKTSTL
jgi:hypothetical protein